MTLSIDTGILARDIKRMADAPQPLIGRPVTDPQVLSDFEFQAKHGMSREQYAERARQWQRQEFEDKATADLNGDPPDNMLGTDFRFPGMTPLRLRYTKYAEWLARESDKLNALERRRADLQSMIEAPAQTEGAIRQALRRTADVLLGKSVDDSDTEQRLKLETRRMEQLHKAEAAKLAMPELEREIEIAKLRVHKLREREPEFLNPVIQEAARDVELRLAECRAEVAALERLLKPLSEFRVYGAKRIEAPAFDIEWGYSWSEIGKALRADPIADISGMLPKL
jgi:chromosome segregation ATPase